MQTPVAQYVERETIGLCRQGQ